MTMHLEKAYLTTTRYNSKQKKSKSKRLAKAHEEHEAWLKTIGVGKSQLPVDKKGRRIGIYEIPDYSTERVTSDRIPGNGNKRETQKYTGSYIIGAATMHKSNCVPITNKQQAIEVSQMRRS